MHELPSLPHTQDAVYSGTMSGEHAVVISDAVKRLPDEYRARADRALAEVCAWRMANDQDGCLHIKAIIDPLNGAKIKAFLLALSKPKTVDGEKDPRTAEQRLADAFIDAMTTTMSVEDLPAHGGSKVQLIVTMFLNDLATTTGSGQTQDGDPISAEPWPYAIRGVRSPAVIGHRPTDLTNLVLLCVHHHHVVHEGDWEISFEHGIPSFIPPRWVDPDQKPVRNIRVDLQLKL